MQFYVGMEPIYAALVKSSALGFFMYIFKAAGTTAFFKNTIFW